MIDIVIVACSKSSKLIDITQNAIDSCIASEFNNTFNIIIVETFKKHNYKNAKIVLFVQNEFNYNTALNKGLEFCKNDIIGFFNNDIIFKKNWFTELKKGFEKFDSLSPNCKFSFDYKGSRFIEGFEVRKQVAGWALVVKRKVFDKIKKFNVELKFWGSDHIFAEQLKIAGFKHALCTSSFVNHLENGSNTLNTLSKLDKKFFTHDCIKDYKNIKIKHKYKFSVIMPSFLGDYVNAATNRETKFIRAVNSFLKQTFNNAELIIISDGCDITVNLYKKHFSKYKNIRCLKIPKQKYMSGIVRQIGIKYAIGEYIIYLDTDDYYKKNHLEFVNNNLKKYDWIYFDDIVKYEVGERIKKVTLDMGKAGTSSICHKRLLNSSWERCDGYGHDFVFIRKLMNESKNYNNIGLSGYVICHLASGNDV